MKVVIENMIANCRLKGDLDLEKMASVIKGARYEPQLFKGVIIEKEEPRSKMFILGDGTVKLHGLTSEDKVKKTLQDLMSELQDSGIFLKISEPLKVTEIIASFSLDTRIDPKEVYEEFKKDGVVYDPTELPGFILKVGKSGIEVLIFPEGKVISRGADNVMDAVSSLQMVESRIRTRD